MDNRVTLLYDLMTRFHEKRQGAPLHAAGIHNAFRALVVHPQYNSAPLTGGVVAWLAQRHTLKGDRGYETPFFRALNTLARLDGSKFDSQSKKGLFLYLSQTAAGRHVGRPETERHAFPAVDAFRNIGLIPLQHPNYEGSRSYQAE